MLLLEKAALLIAASGCIGSNKIAVFFAKITRKAFTKVITFAGDIFYLGENPKSSFCKSNVLVIFMNAHQDTKNIAMLGCLQKFNKDV